jgi:hypothetical protein
MIGVLAEDCICGALAPGSTLLSLSKRRYEPYYTLAPGAIGSPSAAAANAGHDVLVGLFPKQSQTPSCSGTTAVACVGTYGGDANPAPLPVGNVTRVSLRIQDRIVGIQYGGHTT